MFDYTVGDCPVCGCRLYVDTQYPDEIKCEDCDEFEDFSAPPIAGFSRLDSVDCNETKKNKISS